MFHIWHNVGRGGWYYFSYMLNSDWSVFCRNFYIICGHYLFGASINGVNGNGSDLNNIGCYFKADIRKLRAVTATLFHNLIIFRISTHHPSASRSATITQPVTMTSATSALRRGSWEHEGGGDVWCAMRAIGPLSMGRQTSPPSLKLLPLSRYTLFLHTLEPVCLVSQRRSALYPNLPYPVNKSKSTYRTSTLYPEGYPINDILVYSLIRQCLSSIVCGRDVCLVPLTRFSPLRRDNKKKIE